MRSILFPACATLGLMALFVACSSDNDSPARNGDTNTPLARTPAAKSREGDTQGVRPAATPTPQETRAATPTATPTLGLEATFASLNTLVLKPRCVACHSGTNPSANIDLSSYEALRAAQTFPPLVTPLNVSGSLLFEVVQAGRMPIGGKLSVEEVTALKTWIEAGARKSESDPMPTPIPTPTEPPD